jgi:hypothetical protein
MRRELGIFFTVVGLGGLAYASHQYPRYKSQHDKVQAMARVDQENPHVIQATNEIDEAFYKALGLTAVGSIGLLATYVYPAPRPRYSTPNPHRRLKGRSVR